MSHSLRFLPLAGLLLMSFASAQVETFGSPDPRPAATSKSPRLPFSVEVGLDLTGASALRLREVDRAALAQQDMQAESGGPVPTRVGVVRPLIVRPTDGVWHAMGGGQWLWTAEVGAEGALALRLHFASLDLPRGGELIAYAPHAPDRISGPFESTGPFETGDIWTDVLPSDRARIEYRVDGVAPSAAPVLPFQLDALLHVYRDPAFGPQPEGSCAVDSSCDTTISSLRNAVGRLAYIESGNGYLCTGTLLETESNDITPYFATSRDCISTTSVANTAVISWLYQSSTCGGSPPSLGSVPTSSFCSLMASDASAKITLLLVQGTVQSGVYWAGWSSAFVFQGMQGKSIHHPLGAHKMVNLAITTAGFSCESADHFRVQCVNGSLNSGSIGAGFFQSATSQFRGTMTCGPAACGPFFDFGQFSNAYPTFASLLADGSDDSLEPNDACGGLPDVVEGTYTNRIVKYYDPDWYEIVVPAGAKLTVDLAFTHAWGDIDAELWVNCGDASATDVAAGNGNSERLEWINTGAANTVAWKVYLDDDPRNQYSMTVSLTPTNDDCADAITVGNSTFQGTNVNATNSVALAQCGTSSNTRDVWYRYVATQTGVLQISTTGSALDTIVGISNGCGLFEITCNDDAAIGSPVGNGTNDSYISVPVVSGEDYLVRVGGVGSSTNWFNLRLDTDTGAPFCLGDGISALDCPCANHSASSSEAGCTNSTGTAGRLSATGVADVTADTVVLQGSGMPPNSTCLYFQGSAKQSSGNGGPFGDGLRCASGSIIRMGTKTNSGTGTSSYPGVGDLSVSVRGFVSASGGWDYYQVWYRNSAAFCTASTFNLTNGYELYWQP